MSSGPARYDSSAERRKPKPSCRISSTPSAQMPPPLRACAFSMLKITSCLRARATPSWMPSSSASASNCGAFLRLSSVRLIRRLGSPASPSSPVSCGRPLPPGALPPRGPPRSWRPRLRRPRSGPPPSRCPRGGPSLREACSPAGVSEADARASSLGGVGFSISDTDFASVGRRWETEGKKLAEGPGRCVTAAPGEGQSSTAVVSPQALMSGLKTTAPGSSRAGDARNPHVLTCTLRFLLSGGALPLALLPWMAVSLAAFSIPLISYVSAEFLRRLSDEEVTRVGWVGTLGREGLVDQRGQLSLAHRTDLGCLHLAALEDHQGRDTADAIGARSLLVLVGVDLGDLQLALVGLRDVVQQRRDGLARAAPLSPEIHQHRGVGLQHLGFEFIVADVGDMLAHGLVLVRAAQRDGAKMGIQRDFRKSGRQYRHPLHLQESRRRARTVAAFQRSHSACKPCPN